MVRIPTHRAPIHPGEILLEEFLNPMGLTQRELADSILNILRHYEMYPGEAAYPSPRYRGQQEALLAPASGIFLPEPGVEFLTMMQKGDPIARIVNVFGDTLAQLEAPADGMFFGLRALPNVTTGDWRCFFCKVEGTRD